MFTVPETGRIMLHNLETTVIVDIHVLRMNIHLGDTGTMIFFSFLSCCSSQLGPMLTPCVFLFGLLLNLVITMAVVGVGIEIILNIKEEKALTEMHM